MTSCSYRQMHWQPMEVLVRWEMVPDCLTWFQEHVYFHDTSQWSVPGGYKSMCACAQSHSLVQFFATPWTVVCYSLHFPGKNNLVGYHFFPGGSSSPKDGTCIFVSLALAGEFFTSQPPGKPINTHRPSRYRSLGKKGRKRKALVLGILH